MVTLTSTPKVPVKDKSRSPAVRIDLIALKRLLVDKTKANLQALSYHLSDSRNLCVSGCISNMDGQYTMDGSATYSLRTADVFPVERSDDRKYVCCSQAMPRMTRKSKVQSI